MEALEKRETATVCTISHYRHLLCCSLHHSLIHSRNSGQKQFMELSCSESRDSVPERRRGSETRLPVKFIIKVSSRPTISKTKTVRDLGDSTRVIRSLWTLSQCASQGPRKKKSFGGGVPEGWGTARSRARPSRGKINKWFSFLAFNGSCHLARSLVI